MTNQFKWSEFEFNRLGWFEWACANLAFSLNCLRVCKIYIVNFTIQNFLKYISEYFELFEKIIIVEQVQDHLDEKVKN